MSTHDQHFMKWLLIVPSLLMLTGVPRAANARAASSAPATVRLCVVSTVSGRPMDWIATGNQHSVTLATEQWQKRFRGIGLTLRAPRYLNDGSQNGSDVGLAARNARTCVQEADILSVVGPTFSSEAPASMPILNRAGMAQISASATHSWLTSPSFRATLEPLTASHQLSAPTFFRPVPTDTVLNASAIAFVKERLHARTYFLVRDTDEVGRVFDADVEAYGKKIGMQEVGSAPIDPGPRFRASVDAVTDAIVARHPDAVIYAGTSDQVQVPVMLRKKGYAGPIMEGSNLLESSAWDGTWSGYRFPDPHRLLNGVKGLYTVVNGADPSAAGPAFLNQFHRRFHASAPPYSTYAFDSANILLDSIYKAATHGQLKGSLLAMRSAVASRVAAVRWRGVTGTVSFDRNGDAHHPAVGVYLEKQDGFQYVGVAPPVGVDPTS